MKARRNQFSPSRLCWKEAEEIAIFEWIETVPIPVAQARGYVPATLRRLDLLPPFPKKFDYLTAHRFLMRNREGTKTKLPMPVLALGGERTMGAAAGGVRLNEAVERLQVKVVPRAAHWVIHDAPDFVSQQLLSLFAETK